MATEFNQDVTIKIWRGMPRYNTICINHLALYEM
jgi:hypothetical protein